MILMLIYILIIMFVSKVKIFVKAGNGGKGVISFRREKFVPFGGPNGGNGGKGGDIRFIADKSVNTLAYFKYHRHFFAEHGEAGSSNNCHGKDGLEYIITVPVGTAIFNKDNELLFELTSHQQQIIIFKGGHGGIGNGKMATSTDRAPRISLPPGTCEMQEINMVLTLKTDVGILGAPNAGKSSLINTLSRANSIVGNYEFTTINPVLGQMYDSNISLMDLPGIIEGAHRGKGKGLEFLRHSEQCKIFIHLIDISKTPEIDYQMILQELEKYGNKLIQIPALIVLNKNDLLDLKSVIKIKKQFKNKECFVISTVTGEGIEELKNRIKVFFPIEEPINLINKEEELADDQVQISYYDEGDELYWDPYINLLRLVGDRILKHNNDKKILSLILTNTSSMIDLNKTHRQKEKDTNVISLELQNNEFCLGEVILSYNKIYEEYESFMETNISKYSSFQEYLCFIFIHGLMHLYGFDHKNETEEALMTSKEEFYLNLMTDLYEDI